MNSGLIRLTKFLKFSPEALKEEESNFRSWGQVLFLGSNLGLESWKIFGLGRL